MDKIRNYRKTKWKKNPAISREIEIVETFNWSLIAIDHLCSARKFSYSESVRCWKLWRTQINNNRVVRSVTRETWRQKWISSETSNICDAGAYVCTCVLGLRIALNKMCEQNVKCMTIPISQHGHLNIFKFIVFLLRLWNIKICKCDKWRTWPLAQASNWKIDEVEWTCDSNSCIRHYHEELWSV